MHFSFKTGDSIMFNMVDSSWALCVNLYSWWIKHLSRHMSYTKSRRLRTLILTAEPLEDCCIDLVGTLSAFTQVPKRSTSKVGETCTESRLKKSLGLGTKCFFDWKCSIQTTESTFWYSLTWNIEHRSRHYIFYSTEYKVESLKREAGGLPISKTVEVPLVQKDFIGQYRLPARR